jgi:hypothetical protein
LLEEVDLVLQVLLLLLEELELEQGGIDFLTIQHLMMNQEFQKL